MGSGKERRTHLLRTTPGYTLLATDYFLLVGEAWQANEGLPTAQNWRRPVHELLLTTRPGWGLTPVSEQQPSIFLGELTDPGVVHELMKVLCRGFLFRFGNHTVDGRNPPPL